MGILLTRIKSTSIRDYYFNQQGYAAEEIQQIKNLVFWINDVVASDLYEFNRKGLFR